MTRELFHLIDMVEFQQQTIRRIVGFRQRSHYVDCQEWQRAVMQTIEFHDRLTELVERVDFATITDTESDSENDSSNDDLPVLITQKFQS